ncbi:hypothetical protein ANN_20541 [Periplaneta americana]|uniref:Uncharacterized protein n=1 Tax=Periplaneta americana TaxID=6978 RepID=A0ABQ8SDC9_PERAM|nr:hypothetical protein ANN_20541 [Periplaneta americana]
MADCEMISESDHSDSEVKGKRRRNEEEWKRNKIKRLKCEGKSHENWAGKTAEARTTGSDCRRPQDEYLQALVSSRPIQRRRAKFEEGVKRSASYVYKIKLGSEEHVVCLKAFCSLHGMTEAHVKRLCKLLTSGLSPQDMRGKHHNRPNAVKPNVQALMDCHIRKFPYRVAHYSNSDGKRRYQVLYELFLKEHDPDNYVTLMAGQIDVDKVHGIVSYRTFLTYFRDNFNYEFGRPQVGKCRKCEELNVKVQSEKNKSVREWLQVELNLHKTKAKVFYTELERCKKLSDDENDTEMITFDFQQNLLFQ